MIVTKHGNQYTELEWQEMMSQWDKEYQENGDYEENCEEIKTVAAQKLVSLAGVEESKSYGLAHRIFVQGTHGIEFSFEENRIAVSNIEKWIEEEERKIR